jgi:hypothetical protein
LERILCNQRKAKSKISCEWKFCNNGTTLLVYYWCMMCIVTTLALGSWLKQGLARLRAKRETWESHLMLLGVKKGVREWTLTLPSEIPFWELESVATLFWPSVGVKPNTWKKWGFGVLRDSRMFRAQQQGAKHLALGCSWCRWKGLKT